ncbi:MAG: tetratricopeptide repeat protein [Planctomycetota bacterium]
MAIPPTSAQTVVGEPAPPLRFEAFRTRQVVDLQNLRGRVVVVHFFLGLDRQSRKSMPELLRVMRQYGQHGLALVSVSVDNNQAAVVGFADTFKADWPIEYSNLGRMSATRTNWEPPLAPWVVVVGADGIVEYAGSIATLEPAVVAALGKAGIEGFEVMTPEGLAKELEAVTADFDARRFGAAIRRLTAIPVSAVEAGTPQADTYAALVERARQFGDAAFAEADAMITDGDYLGALDHLERIATELADTGFDTQARERIEALKRDPAAKAALAEVERRDRAAKALEMAQMLEDRGQPAAALARYRSIARLFAGLPEAAAAEEAIERLAADLPKRDDGDELKRAETIYRLAESYRAAGRDERAREKYEEVIDKYPDTFWARKSREALAELD